MLTNLVSTSVMLFLNFFALINLQISPRRVCPVCDRAVRKIRGHLIRHHDFETGSSRLREAVNASYVFEGDLD